MADPLHSEKGEIQMIEFITTVPEELCVQGELHYPLALVLRHTRESTVKDSVGQWWDQQHQDSYVIKTHCSPREAHI